MTMDRLWAISEAAGINLDVAKAICSPECEPTTHHRQLLQEGPIEAVVEFIREFQYTLEAAEQLDLIPLAAFWMLRNGRLPEGCFEIIQTCKNASCVNPEHLVLTQLENNCGPTGTGSPPRRMRRRTRRRD